MEVLSHTHLGMLITGLFNLAGKLFFHAIKVYQVDHRIPAGAGVSHSAIIDLNTHITDIVNLLYMEDLHDVVLVGLSYACQYSLPACLALAMCRISNG
ncbi:hypothetical protein [Chitinophaga eiseniae]|nr:hypothetical protein [Chitinophaga eiseniae]